jgi:iron complex outermembrane recepter protein
MNGKVINRCSIAGASAAATASGLLASLSLTVIPSELAQAQDTLGLEEVVVTARRREENLRDVPVAISVLSDDFIAEAGILDQYDLFAETPGIQYEQSRERAGARPSVRGVLTTSQEVLRQKVSTFIDGFPVLAQQGITQFVGIERIEVLRGPQSAAFGRSTFSGAINYVTRDPGEEFSSRINVAASDLNRETIGLSFDGPITDTLGYMIDFHTEEFQGPDEWTATDGVELGSTSTDYLAAKFVWAPTDKIEMKLNLSILETEDGPTNETFVGEEERLRCLPLTLPNGEQSVDGDFNCNPDSGLPLKRNADVTVGLTPGTAEFFIAQANSIFDPRTFIDRERATFEFNYSTDNGSLLQVMTSYTKDEGARIQDNDFNNTPLNITCDPCVLGDQISRRIGMNTMARGTPRVNEDTFADVRWISPGDKPVRWLVGASWFDYERKDDTFDQFSGILLGLEDEVNGGLPFQATRRTFAQATAIGLYGNVAWDVTDRTTLSFEARQQEDDVTDTNEVSGLTFNSVTDSFQPRLAINYTLNDDWSLYGQASQGTNPAGSNVIFADPETVLAIQDARDAGFITYDETTFRSHDEEELTNFEIGIKGSALDNRLQLSAAIYTMDWDDMVLGAAFDWEGDVVNGTANGDPCPMGVASCWNDGTSPNAVAFNGGQPWDDDEVASGMVFINSGTGDLFGIEAEATWQATDNWNFRGAISLQNNDFDERCAQEPVNDFRFTPTSTQAGDGALFDCFDVSGNQLVGTAEESGSFTATYRAALGTGDWEWMGRLGVRYQSRKPMDVMNLVWLPADTQWDGSVTFTNDNWNVVLFGNNLTDENTPRQLTDDPVNQFDAAFAGNRPNYRYALRIPREIGVRLNYQF